MTVSKAVRLWLDHRAPRPQNIKEELVDFTDKVRIEIIAPDEMVDALVDQIVRWRHRADRRRAGVVNDVSGAVFIRKTVGPTWPGPPRAA